MSDPIRLFVGCAANNEDLESQSVLEWSIRKNTKREVAITWMQLTKDPTSPFFSDWHEGWDTRFWTTPFSGFRWSIPAVCGFEGQGIYSDSDVIFLADIGELWDQKFQPGKIIMAKGGEAAWRYCVSKWDCAAAKSHLPSWTHLHQSGSHGALMKKFADSQSLVQKFEGQWNCLDGEGYKDLSHPNLKALHYTNIPTQPQLRHSLQRMANEGGRHWFRGTVKPHWRKDIIDLFDTLLIEATSNGYGIERYRRKTIFGDHRKAA